MPYNLPPRMTRCVRVREREGESERACVCVPRTPAPPSCLPHLLPPPPLQVSSIGTLLVVCGPSGVGKGTLISQLVREHGDKFGFRLDGIT